MTAAARVRFRSPADVLRARGKLGPYTTPTVASVPTIDPDPAVVRAWAARHGIDVAPRGRIPASVVEQYRASQAGA